MPGFVFFCPIYVIALLCGVVRAGLTNYTIDDEASAVVYSHTPILRCTPSSCSEAWTNQLFNGTSTLTESPIIVSFTGSAIYAYLDVAGACIFNIDGDDVGVFNNTVPSGDIQLAYHNTSIPDGPHLLLISPADTTTLIEFDYVIVSKNSPRKALVGAIVGGVVGGMVLFVGLFIAGLFLRRRAKQRKLFLRGIPLGDDDKASIKMGQLSTKK
ncbi:hypothetical protein C8R44DRAFT_234155 [Mycena epipterygia]|nr:hypothetical protein C8R44DRAFT_234155 [Mycena epipterygia]